MTGVQTCALPIYDDDAGLSLLPPLHQDEDLLCAMCNGLGHIMWECPKSQDTMAQDGEKMVEHGIFPSTKEASMEDATTMDVKSSGESEHGMFPSARESSDDAHPMAFIFGGDKVEEVEHGSFASTNGRMELRISSLSLRA